MKSKHTKVDISSSKQKIDPILDKQSKLLKRALSYIKNYEHAKDFVQDTLVAVWLTKTKIKNPVAYAKTVLEREIWKEAKKHSRSTCYLEEIPNSLKLFDVTKEIKHTVQEDIDDNIYNEEMCDMLYKAMDTLDNDKREIVILHVVEKMTVDDVAEEKGISRAKVKKDYAQAMAQLRTIMRKMQQNDYIYE